MATNKNPEQHRKEIEDALDDLAGFIEKIAGMNPRKLKTPEEVQELNRRLEDVVTEKGSEPHKVIEPGTTPRTKVMILRQITAKNTFDVLIEVLVDIRDALGVEGIEPVRKGEAPKKRARKVTAPEIVERKRLDREMGERLIRLLNQETGRRYKFVDANMDLVMGRIKEYRAQGYEDVERLLTLMVRMKCQEGKRGDFPEKYLRPATLFNKTKCAQYVGEVPIDTVSP